MSSQEQLFEKSVSFAVVAVCIAALPTTAFVFSVVVVGMGHGVMAWIYQWRAGKLRGRRLQFLWLGAISLFVLYTLYPNRPLLIGVTVIYFSLHFLVDEIFLLRDSATPMRLLEILPSLVMMIGYVLDAAFFNYQFVFFFPYAVFVGACLLALYVVLKLRSGQRIGVKSIYLISFSFFFFGLYAMKGVFSLYPIFGAMGLYHYINWYINYYFKLQNNSDRLRHYLRDVAWVNAVFVVCLLFYLQNPESWFLFICDPTYFLLWTLLHLTTSLRASDLAFFRPAD